MLGTSGAVGIQARTSRVHVSFLETPYRESDKLCIGEADRTGVFMSAIRSCIIFSVLSGTESASDFYAIPSF